MATSESKRDQQLRRLSGDYDEAPVEVTRKPDEMLDGARGPKVTASSENAPRRKS